MRKLIVPLVIIAVLGLSVSGCGKKNAPKYNKNQEQSQSLTKS